MEQKDWSKSLPRNYHNYSTPQPFVAGSTNFSKYRKTNFASKRSMFENMAKDDATAKPTSAKSVENLYERPSQNKEVLKRIEPVVNKPATVNSQYQKNHDKSNFPVKGNVSAIMASLKESTTPKQRTGPPPKHRLVDLPKSSEPEIRKSDASNVTATATLTPRGLVSYC